jgi:hypothetical protein
VLVFDTVLLVVAQAQAQVKEEEPLKQLLLEYKPPDDRVISLEAY